MNKVFKIILVVLILLPLAWAIGLTIFNQNQAKAADIRLLKVQKVDYDILFKGLDSEIKVYGYYLTKADGTKILLVVNPEGGVIEIQR
jgi:hypothetical protein